MYPRYALCFWRRIFQKDYKHYNISNKFSPKFSHSVMASWFITAINKDTFKGEGLEKYFSISIRSTLRRALWFLLTICSHWFHKTPVANFMKERFQESLLISIIIFKIGLVNHVIVNDLSYVPFRCLVWHPMECINTWSRRRVALINFT